MATVGSTVHKLERVMQQQGRQGLARGRRWLGHSQTPPAGTTDVQERHTSLPVRAALWQPPAAAA